MDVGPRYLVVLQAAAGALYRASPAGDSRIADVGSARHSASRIARLAWCAACWSFEVTRKGADVFDPREFAYGPGISARILMCAMCCFVACDPNGCNNSGPGAAIRWTGYPALAKTTTSYNWLVVKCQLSDNDAIPAGLDTSIQKFLGVGGLGYGNIVDYFHDVSYNRASVVGTEFVGWVKAPFSTSDMASPRGRVAPPGARAQRVKECLQAIPQDQGVDFADYYGVVVINNVVNDGGACYIGQQNLTINNKNFNLACVWFDPNSLFTDFAAHEIAHGLGLTHSYDDSGGNCSAGPGEYCDPWDIMSAMQTYTFADRNWLINGASSAGGPGMNAPNLLRMGWIPAQNQKQYDLEQGGNQVFKLRALSRARPSDALVAILNVGANSFDNLYTVEFRQGDGWDNGFVSDLGSPLPVRLKGGTVLVHQFRFAEPVSTLINGAYGGALQPFNTVVLPGFGGLNYHVTVLAIDIFDASATVEIGSGRGPAQRKFAAERMFEGRAHANP
jgi:M6 family metalloprotease-like protein